MNEAQAERWNGDSGRRWVAERERHAAVRKPLLPHLFAAAAIQPGERVLDVGCGCGESSMRAAALGGVVTGIDISQPMLDAARDDAPGVEFLLADAQAYPLPRAEFDVVISSFGVMFFDDPGAAFANFRRCLRPSGRLAFLCWQPQSDNDLFAIPMRAFGVPFDDAVNPFSDPAWVKKLLRRAGFAGVDVAPVTAEVCFGHDVADVLDYQASSPLVRNFDGPRGPGFTAMAAEYAARQRLDGVWVGAAAWLVTAHRDR